MPLSKEIKERIKEGFNQKPCIRCGDQDHSVSECPGGMGGSVWRTLDGTDELAADTEIKKLVKNQKKRAKNEGEKGAKKQEPQKTVPSTHDPYTHDPATNDSIIAPRDFPSAAAANASKNQPDDSTSPAELPQVQDQARAEPVETEYRKDTRVPSMSQVSATQSHKPKGKLSTLVRAKYPLRKEFSKSTSEVLTNHFDVFWDPDAEFYVYEILDVPAGSKRKTKSVVKTAVQAWDFLRDNEDFLATDYRRTIVAWKNLHESIQYRRRLANDNELIWEPSPIADGDRLINLGFKFRGLMNLHRLKDFTDPTSKPQMHEALPDFQYEVLIDLLNTVISKNLTDDVFRTSSHKFYIKSGHERLGDSHSLCVMRGYYYTTKPAMDKVLLNVNAATSAFYRSITVAEFLKDHTFAENERERRIKGLRVYIAPDRLRVQDKDEQAHVDHLNAPQSRIKTIKSFGKPIGNREEREFYFPRSIRVGNQVQSQDTHVVDHMETVFGRGARFDHALRAVNVGADDDPVWYPQEFLRILPYQPYTNLLPSQLVDSMISCACKPPDAIKKRIEGEGLKGLGVVLGNENQKFAKCKALTIVPKMLRIASTKMDPVHVAYGGNNGRILKTPDAQSRWNLTGTMLFLETPASPQTFDYCMLIGPDLENARTADNYANELSQQIRRYRIANVARCVSKKTLPSFFKHDSSMQKKRLKTHEELKGDIAALMQECKKATPAAKLVVLLLQKRHIAAYSAFKDVADRIFGLQSVCVTEEKNIKKPEKLPQYIGNVMMKVNLKRGGRNHTVSEDIAGKNMLNKTLKKVVPQRSTMILGADVTHPGGSSLTGCPSIAALVGSVDCDGGKFLGSMRLQDTSKKEIIDKIKEMAEERFRAWSKVNYDPPDVLYYRDGVSDAQFDAVLKHEVTSIKAAWEKVWPNRASKVKMTTVVTIKRHHTRFFPLPNQAHSNGNCHAGTLVDNGITSPFFSEFFLQSHHALKGTAIPTRYFVLENGIGYSDIELQRLTHKLCFTYVRATTSVSYAPPAYYADRLCERGRQYLRDWFTPNYDSAHFKEYESRKDKIARQYKDELKADIARLPPQPVPEGRKKARKSEEQVRLERKSRKRVEEKVEKVVLETAMDYMNEMRDGGCGPWHQNLDETMFWM